MEVREIMTDRFNLLVKTFKQANPNLTHEKAQKRVKDYYDTIKNKFGTHLDENGKIIDGVKELQNFRKAGETLSEIWSKMTIDDYEVSAKWVDPSNASKAYHDFRDSKIGKNWLESHVFISKYYLEIAKCNDIECCQSVRSNVQEVLGGKFLPAPLALSGGPYLIDPCKNDETQKISGFYQSLVLQHLRPKDYKKCKKPPYDLYCPSTEANNADYVCRCVHIYSARKYVQWKNCYYTTLKQHNTMHTKRLTWSILKMICMRMKKSL